MAFDIVMHVNILLMKKGKYLLGGEIVCSNRECLFLSFHSTDMHMHKHEGFKGLELGTETL